MPLVIGALFALAAGVFATAIGLDRDRAFYPTVMIVIALLYSLFAVMGGSTDALLVELGIGAFFIVLAVVGFRGSLWLVAFALAAHGVMDLFHWQLVANPGVPVFWPAFCGAYDLVAAGYLGWLIRSHRLPATT